MSLLLYNRRGLPRRSCLLVLSPGLLNPFIRSNPGARHLSPISQRTQHALRAWVAGSQHACPRLWAGRESTTAPPAFQGRQRRRKEGTLVLEHIGSERLAALACFCEKLRARGRSLCPNAFLKVTLSGIPILSKVPGFEETLLLACKNYPVKLGAPRLSPSGTLPDSGDVLGDAAPELVRLDAGHGRCGRHEVLGQRRALARAAGARRACTCACSCARSCARRSGARAHARRQSVPGVCCAQLAREAQEGGRRGRLDASTRT
jgi:hypothetical protein